MFDIFNYIAWRGDISFENDPLNELDALVFARLSYLPLSNIVKDNISIKDAYNVFSKKKINKNKILNVNDPKLFQTIANANRYKDLILSNYVNSFDVLEEKQFAAITIKINKKTSFVSFIGTDNSITGWKEDLNLSYLDYIPSQELACKYLLDVKCKKLYVGGHSKGGNLAIYASGHLSSLKSRKLVNVYNFDGPGFSKGFIDTKGYITIVDKIKTFMPQESIIGTILNRKEKENIVYSINRNIMQHDVYSWRVIGKNFIYKDTFEKSSDIIRKTISSWLDKTSYEQRKEFADTVYEILEIGNPPTIDDAFSCMIKNASSVIKTYKGVDKDVKEALSYFIKLGVSFTKKSLVDSIKRTKKSNLK